MFEYRAKAVMDAKSQKDSTKARILRAAEDLFARKGYKGTTIRDIADMADANIALVHYHWGSKEELWNAVQVSRAQDLMEFAAELIAETPDFDSPEMVRDFVFRLFDYLGILL